MTIYSKELGVKRRSSFELKDLFFWFLCLWNDTGPIKPLLEYDPEYMPELKQVDEFAQGRAVFDSSQLHSHFNKIL